MSILEFIGFILSMIFMGIMYIRRMKAERYRREHPEEFPEEEHEYDEELEAYLRSQHMSVERQRRPTPPPSPPSVHAKKTHVQEAKRLQTQSRNVQKMPSRTSMEQYRKESDLANPTYEVERLNTHKRVKDLIEQLSSPQDLMLLKEILGPPKALQQSWNDSMAASDERP